jgi:hypothetical protein
MDKADSNKIKGLTKATHLDGNKISSVSPQGVPLLEGKDGKCLQYSEEELQARARIMAQLTKTRNERYKNWTEFNDMTYVDFYNSNAKSANSYIPPRVNPQDVKIVTGTTEEKEVSLIAALLNFNLKPEIIPYTEENDILLDLGEKLSSAVQRSRDIEDPDYEEQRAVIYKELLDQGTVFVQDLYIETQEIEKTFESKDWQGVIKMNKTWREKLSDVKKHIITKLVPGLNVYLGNFREPYIQNQPYIGVRQLMSYEEAASMFGQWERWQYVPYSMSPMKFDEAALTEPYNSFVYENTAAGMVEVFFYYNKFLNEFQLLVNGVMMLPIGFPLSALNGKNVYPLACAKFTPISSYFAYGKGIPAKTKVDQALIDEMYKLAILKTRQSFMPPMANNTGQVLSDEIFYPGVMTKNINPALLSPLVPPTGVTNSEFAMMQFMQGTIDGKTVSAVFTGDPERGEQSATEIMERKKQSMMKLGLPVLACVSLEKQLAKLRLFNILHHWTEPDEKFNPVTQSMEKAYMGFMQPATFKDGTEGIEVVQFQEDVPAPEQVNFENELLSTRMGMPVRKAYIDPKILKSLNLMFKIEVEPHEQNNDELERAQFLDAVTVGYNLFGQDAFNKPFLKAKFARLNKESKNQLFVSEEQLQAQQQMMMQQMMAQQGGMPQEAEGPAGMPEALTGLNNAAPSPRPLQEMAPQV